MKTIQSLTIQVKKTHPDAKLPKYTHDSDGAADLTAVSYSDRVNGLTGYIEYDTGLSFEIPEGYVGLLFQRSSVTNKDIILGTCVGVVDATFRGNVTFRFRQLGPDVYKIGERIGQIMIIPRPQISFVDTDELSDTIRGTGGYGSSGN